MICYWFPAPDFFFFAEGIPELLYYSHFPTTALALIVGLFVLIKGREFLANRLLFLISVFFSIWTLTSLILWTRIDSDFLIFIWTIHVSMFSFIAIYSVYFVYAFLTGHDVTWKIKGIFAGLLAPILVFGATNLNLSGFDIANCDAFMYEGSIYKTYYIALSVLAMLWIFFLLVKHYRKASNSFKKQIVMLGIGIEFFLFTFFSLVFLASYLTTFGFFQDSRLELFGLFGMTFFMVVMGMLLVRSKSFNVKMHAAEALTVALIILIASQYTYAHSNTTTIVLTSVTLVLTAITGLYLNRSVRNEIKQRKRIEELAKELARANKRLRKLDKAKSEFVSIASHQLRSPLTAMRGYASMLLEGSYGKLPQKALKVVERIADSGKNMALLVEDYLSVSRIESGNMKYDLADFNLVEETQKVVDDKRQEAIRSGLVLLSKTNMERKGIVHADRSKVVQILHNLINNAIKYTPKGSITVYIHEDSSQNMVHIDITDTGVGMTEEETKTIFGKFERAEGASKVNTSGTGLGLFVAKSMTEHMGGSVTAFSEGKGKGSTFRISLPLTG